MTHMTMWNNTAATGETAPGQRILHLLENAGGWHSGEALARTLGVSRTAVAKHVAALRDAGHVIRSRTHKGYWLEIKAEPLRADSANTWLTTKTLGRNGWREFAETGSTNNEAIAWALAGAPEGAVVTAETQTDGRGRKGHDWFSSPRGVAASVILRPGTPGQRPGALTGETATRAALKAMQAATLETAGVRTDIREPNDLCLNGKKLCGILAEAGWRGGEPDWIVLGAGCNVAVLPEEFPGTIAGRVTSLYAETGQVVSKNRLLAAFLNHFEEIVFHSPQGERT